MNPLRIWWNADPHRRGKRVVRLWALAFALCVVVPFICWRVGLSRKVDSRLKTARAAGYPVNAVELDTWYPYVSPEENAAVIYDRAFFRIVRRATPEWRKVKLPARKEAMSEGLRVTITGALADNREALDLLHQAAQRKKSRYPINLTMGPNTLLPHLSALEACARLFELEVIDALENGNTDEAVGSVQASTGLGRSLMAEPLPISQTVRLSLNNTGYRSLERIMNRTRLTDRQLQDLSSILLETQSRAAFTRALIGERAIGVGMFDAPFREPMPPPRSPGSPKLENVAVELLTPLVKASGFFERDRIFYLDTMQLYVETTLLPPPTNLERAKNVESRLDEAKSGHYVLSGILLPGLRRTMQKNLESIALAQAAQAALGIERFRLQHGDRLPDSLAALAPNYIQSVPLDPFDGRPLRYQRLAQGYVVYSIGPDQADDGGREKKEKVKHTDPVEPSDVTFTVER